MIFVDTNVFMYAVGREHPLRSRAHAFFQQAVRPNAPRLCTSAEVVQELLHVYLPAQRLATFDDALRLLQGTVAEIWSIEPDDVEYARSLADTHPERSARDLLHVACCLRRNVARVKTFDRELGRAFDQRKP